MMVRHPSTLRRAIESSEEGHGQMARFFGGKGEREQTNIAFPAPRAFGIVDTALPGKPRTPLGHGL